MAAALKLQPVTAGGAGHTWRERFPRFCCGNDMGEDKSSSTLARVSLRILGLSSSHCSTSLLWIGILLGFDIANWTFYGLCLFIFIFNLALVFMTSEDPYRHFKDRFIFIGFMNNKIKLLVLLLVYRWCLQVELCITEMHMMHDTGIVLSASFTSPPRILWKNPTSLSTHPISLPRWITPFGVG